MTAERPEIFKKLRDKLDHMSFGYKKTDRGVEYAALEILFTPKDAEWFVGLGDGLKSAAEAADLMGATEEEAHEQLEQMATNGLIFRTRKNGVLYYRVLPMFHGIYEFNRHRLSADWLAPMFDHYLSSGMANEVMHMTHPFFRGVPVSSSLAPGSEVMICDSAEKLIDSKSRIAVAPCVCRETHAALGNPPKDDLNVCIAFDDFADYYVDNGHGHYIDNEEALRIVRSAETDGCVLQMANSERPEIMCKCNAQTCGFLPVVKNFPGPGREVFSNYYSVTDADKCAGKCFDLCSGRCPMDARKLAHGKAETIRENCIGCGLCVKPCPKGAISMLRKENSYMPPDTIWTAYARMNESIHKNRS